MNSASIRCNRNGERRAVNDQGWWWRMGQVGGRGAGKSDNRRGNLKHKRLRTVHCTRAAAAFSGSSGVGVI